AAWTSAKVEPSLVPAVDRRVGQGQGAQLTAFVLHSGLTGPDGDQLARLATGQSHRIRRPRTRRSPRLPDQIVSGQAAGPGHQVDSGPAVVGEQRGRRLDQISV